MTQLQVEVPDEVANKFLKKRRISYADIIHEYEKSFEYEKIGMEAGKFKNFLISELSHD